MKEERDRMKFLVCEYTHVALQRERIVWYQQPGSAHGSLWVDVKEDGEWNQKVRKIATTSGRPSNATRFDKLGDEDE